MTLIQIIATLIVLAGLFGVINALFLKLPAAIGILIVALLASIAALGIDAMVPALSLAEDMRVFVAELDFDDTLLDWMLGLLLFAGALHVKVKDLRAEWAPVALMATLGVALSVAIIGTGFSLITGLPILVALVFGAIVSPTDPVAVLGVLRAADLPRPIETNIAGESLFNDGVAYVVFLILVGLAFHTGDAHIETPADAAELFAQEALGGAALGIALGWLSFQIMRRIDDATLEVLITLGLALGGYELAIYLHLSGPIFAVCAGLLIGDVGARDAMSEQTRAYINTFWEIVDEILNAILFLMIGVEVFAIVFEADILLAGAGAILLALLGRLAAVAVPILILRPFRGFERGMIPVMTWGGLKGGISVALALSLPANEWEPLILTATYMVVIFSIIVQGLSVATVARRVTADPSL